MLLLGAVRTSDPPALGGRRMLCFPYIGGLANPLSGPCLGQIKLIRDRPTGVMVADRQTDRSGAIGQFSELAAVLMMHSERVRTLRWKRRIVDDTAISPREPEERNSFWPLPQPVEPYSDVRRGATRCRAGGDRPAHRRAAQCADFRRGARRIELHVCAGDLDSGARRLDQRPRRRLRGDWRRAGALLVPDNTKVAVIKACLYDPQINRSYADMAAHYGTTILPARPRRPREGRAGSPHGRALAARAATPQHFPWPRRC